MSDIRKVSLVLLFCVVLSLVIQSTRYMEEIGFERCRPY
jgi:hypothetical protein